MIGLVVIIGYAVSGWDPVVRLFFWIGTAGGFGILLLVALTSIAVIFYFARNAQGEGAWHRIVAPLLAAIALGTMVYYAVINFQNLLGVAADDPLRYIIPATYPVVAVLGFVWALFLKASKPEIYATIGLGADSVAALGAQSRGVPPQQEAQHSAPSNQDLMR